MNTPLIDEAEQRYLDREMNPAEKADFLARLSEAERAELLATQSALEALEGLPRMPVPASLARNVMAAVTPKRQSAWARVRLWLEQRPMLGWEFGGAAMAASALIVVLVPLSMTPPVENSAQVPSSLKMASHNPAAESNALQFSLYAPQAQNVALIGDFNGWGSMGEVKLAPVGKGIWSANVALPAGRYQYAFLVNGQHWVTDPRAQQHVKDDFGRQNAVITKI